MFFRSPRRHLAAIGGHLAPSSLGEILDVRTYACGLASLRVHDLTPACPKLLAAAVLRNAEDLLL